MSGPSPMEGSGRITPKRQRGSGAQKRGQHAAGDSSHRAGQSREPGLAHRILAHVGEPATPPAVLPSRAPPAEEFGWDQGGAEDFDQRTKLSEQPD